MNGVQTQLESAAKLLLKANLFVTKMSMSCVIRAEARACGRLTNEHVECGLSSQQLLSVNEDSTETVLKKVRGHATKTQA